MNLSSRPFCQARHGDCVGAARLMPTAGPGRLNLREPVSPLTDPLLAKPESGVETPYPLLLNALPQNPGKRTKQTRSNVKIMVPGPGASGLRNSEIPTESQVKSVRCGTVRAHLSRKMRIDGSDKAEKKGPGLRLPWRMQTNVRNLRRRTTLHPAQQPRHSVWCYLAAFFSGTGCAISATRSSKLNGL